MKPPSNAKSTGGIFKIPGTLGKIVDIASRQGQILGNILSLADGAALFERLDAYRTSQRRYEMISREQPAKKPAKEWKPTMRPSQLITLFLACLFANLAAPAIAKSSCPVHFAGGEEPTMPAKLEPRTRELCYTRFALLHSGISRTALWSAERITRKSVKAARQVERTSDFFSETRLPKTDRSELSDFKYSGFDRGHLAPSGNMPSQKAQKQSFSLANIIAQHPRLNRRAWRSIEADVRDAAYKFGTAYIVTGPLFIGGKVKALHGRVLIPTHVWKAVLVPGQGTVVYTATNDAKTSISRLSLSRFEALYGIDPFPALSGPSRSRLLNIS